VVQVVLRAHQQLVVLLHLRELQVRTVQAVLRQHRALMVLQVLQE